jgi:hypothetical protein
VPTSVEISAASQWLDRLGGSLRGAAERGLLAAAQRGVSEIVGRIIPSRSPKPFDRGVFQAGWRAMQVEGGADIFNNEPHAAFIEDGVRAANVKPGMAMLRALASWAERKGLAKKGNGMSMAWAIATKMKRRGIFNGGQGFGILKELIEDRIDDLIAEEVTREIERETG